MYPLPRGEGIAVDASDLAGPYLGGQRTGRPTFSRFLRHAPTLPERWQICRKKRPSFPKGRVASNIRRWSFTIRTGVPESRQAGDRFIDYGSNPDRVIG